MNETYELDFAIVQGARVFVEDHGLRVFYLDLAYRGIGGGSCQGAGGHILDTFNKKLGRRVMVKEHMKIIPTVNKLFDTKSWEQIKGQWVWAIHSNSYVAAIGRYGWEWLDFRRFFQEGKHDLIDFKEVAQRHQITFEEVLLTKERS